MSNVREFGARGDGISDDTKAIEDALAKGDGTLQFPKGDYLITHPINVELADSGRVSIDGSGGAAKILMRGAGPAFHITGTHVRSADPKTFEPRVWTHERMPTISNLEIEGKHPEADGFLLTGTMQATFEGVLLRKLNHAIHIRDRARNVLISHCHLYDNRGTGIFLDHVDLHQIIVTGSHISYCKRGGIKIIGSQIRNLQITGNDIEYNFDANADRSADIWIDTSDGSASVREGTISGNTIQAKSSPGGANILMIGHSPQTNNKVGMFTIAGNLIGTQENNIHLIAVRGIAITGNAIYNGFNRNLLMEHAQNIVIGSNSFDHNPDYGPSRCTGIQFINSTDSIMSGSTLQEFKGIQDEEDDRQGLLEIIRCARITVNGCQILDGYPSAIYVTDSDDISITGCTLLERRKQKETVSTILWNGTGTGNLLSNNRIGNGTAGALSIDETADVQISHNRMDN